MISSSDVPDGELARSSAAKIFAVDERTFMLALEECNVEVKTMSDPKEIISDKAEDLAIGTLEVRNNSDEAVTEIIFEKAEDLYTGKVFGSLECNSKLDEATSDLCSSAPNEHVDGEVMSSISMNGTYVLEDEIILKEFLEEIHVSTEGKLCEDCDLDLESPYFQDSDCVTAVDTEGKFLEGNDSSESRILSDLRNSSESNISTFSSDDSALIRVSLEDSKKYLDDDLAHVDFRSIDCGNPVNFPEESSSVSEFCCDELPNVETSGASNDRFLSHQEMKSVHLKPSDDQLIQVLCELDQSERELDESENPSNEAIQNIVSLIGNEQSDEGMDVPLEDEQTLEEESTYSIFKFLVHEEKDRNQFSDVDNNADVCQESQQNEPNVISSRISSPNMIVGSGSCNFISLEAWIDDTSGMDTDLQEDQHEKESQNVETHAIDPVVESSGQHFEDGHNEELDVDQNGLSQTFDFKVRALSPVTRGSFSSEEPKKGKEGFMLKARVEHFIQKLEEKSLVGSVSDSIQLQSLVKRVLPSIDLNCSEISEQIERERDIVPCTKQHTPLKSLLKQANHDVSQETLNLTLTPLNRQLNQSPFLKQEARKEWNSPARLPGYRAGGDHRRKVKVRPQWVPFLCCPSLN